MRGGEEKAEADQHPQHGEEPVPQPPEDKFSDRWKGVKGHWNSQAVYTVHPPALQMLAGEGNLSHIME